VANNAGGKRERSWGGGEGDGKAMGQRERERGPVLLGFIHKKRPSGKKKRKT